MIENRTGTLRARYLRSSAFIRGSIVLDLIGGHRRFQSPLTFMLAARIQRRSDLCLSVCICG
jgi:hypothetical protein